MSAAVTLTVVVPIEKKWPESGEQVTVAGLPNISFAVGLNGTEAPPGAVAAAVMWDNDNVGGVVGGLTVTVKPSMPMLPYWSVAVALTSVCPMAKGLPEAGEQATVAGLPNISVADGENVTTAPAAEVALAVTGANTSVGAVKGAVTLTVKLPVLVVP